MEIDLILEKNFELFTYEIKLSKTPTVKMAAPQEEFIKSYSRIKINSSKIIYPGNENIRLTRNVETIIIDFFLKNVCKV